MMMVSLIALLMMLLGRSVRRVLLYLVLVLKGMEKFGEWKNTHISTSFSSIGSNFTERVDKHFLISGTVPYLPIPAAFPLTNLLTFLRVHFTPRKISKKSSTTSTIISTVTIGLNWLTHRIMIIKKGPFSSVVTLSQALLSNSPFFSNLKWTKLDETSKYSIDISLTQMSFELSSCNL